jgi:hypothetical protein
MNPQDARKMVTGHSAGNLTTEERATLYHAAFEDQETFDALMEEEGLRRALEEPGRRQRLVAVLREGSATPWEKIWAWVLQPGGLSVAGTLAAGLLLGVFLARQGIDRPVPVVTIDPYTPKSLPITGAGDQDTELARGVFALPIQSNITVRISLNKTGNIPEYARGEPLQITFETEADAQVLVIEQKPDGGVSRLFPTETPSPIVRAGESVRAPAGTGTLPVEGPAGLHRIRIVALPPGADPLTQAPEWPRVDGRAGVAEVQFRVTE